MPYIRPLSRSFFAAAITLTVFSVCAYAQQTAPYGSQGGQGALRQSAPLSLYQAVQPEQQQPIRPQTLQTPPKSVQQNGVNVYRQDPNQPNSTYQPPTPKQGFFRAAAPPISPSGTENRTPTPGFGAPYQPGPVRVASGQPVAQPTAGPAYGQPQPTPQPGYYAPQPGAQPMPGTPQPRPRVHVGRAAPESRVQPYFLNPQEQRELDEFLVRWEKYSDTIKNYEVQFLRHEFEMEKLDGRADLQNTLRRSTFGNFKYCASPSRFFYHVEGEYIKDPETGKGVKVFAEKDETGSIEQEKIIINEKAFYQYDFNGKKVLQVNLPPEVVSGGIAKSPLPLIFGAKAEDMKKRFSMKIVTHPNAQDREIWLQVRPMTLEDQQEFRELEIRLDKKTLQAVAVTRFEINGTSISRYQLYGAKVNPILGNISRWIRDHFVATIPDRDWTHEVVEWTEDMQAETPEPNPAASNRGVAEPYRPPNPQPPRNEIPLYQPRN